MFVLSCRGPESETLRSSAPEALDPLSPFQSLLAPLGTPVVPFPLFTLGSPCESQTFGNKVLLITQRLLGNLDFQQVLGSGTASQGDDEDGQDCRGLSWHCMLLTVHPHG